MLAFAVAALGFIVAPALLAISDTAAERNAPLWVRPPLRLGTWSPGLPAAGMAAGRTGRGVFVQLVAVIGPAIMAVSIGAEPVLAPVVVLVFASCVITLVDVAHHRIPDRIVGPTLQLLAIGLGVAAFSEGDIGRLRGVGIGAIGYAAMLGVLHLINPAGMGFGDVKLSVALGALLGWFGPALILSGLVLACVLGIATGLAQRVIAGDRGAFPFGPALCASTLIVVAVAA